MTLIALLIALIVERLLSPHRLGDAAPRPPWSAFRALHTLPVLPVLPWLLAAAGAGVVALLHGAIENRPLDVLFDALMLLLCLGPRDLADDVQRLRSARSSGDSATVARLTRSLQLGPEPDADHRSLLGALFIQSHERRFGVLLWFIAAGPAGAVLYRIASRLAAQIEPADPQAPAAALLHALLAWAPTRLTAFLFGFAGSLDDALIAWKRVQAEPRAAAGGWQRHSWNLLAETANAALDWEDAVDGGPMIASSLDSTLGEVLRMEARATLIVLALTALFTAGAWVS